MTCSHTGCPVEVPVKGGARGMCIKHYKRFMKYGRTDLTKVRGFRGKTTEERFWENVVKTEGCWIWTGAKDSLGYGHFGVTPHDGWTQESGSGTKSFTVPAYRFSYELLVAPIPDGLQVDHLCRNPSCVNPDHLEPVSQAENLARRVRS